MGEAIMIKRSISDEDARFERWWKKYYVWWKKHCGNGCGKTKTSHRGVKRIARAAWEAYRWEP